MFKLLIKLVIVLGLGVIPFSLHHLHLVEKKDAFYWKSTYAAPSLILGGSRALKGIAPQVVASELGLEEKSVLNFAFTGIHSPYGERYFNLIKRKIESDKNQSIFILSVLPMSIMDIKDQSKKREAEFKFYDLWGVNSSPNFEYVIRNPRSRISVLEKLYNEKEKDERVKPALQSIVHENGWVETKLLRERKNKTGRSIDKLIKWEMTNSKEREEWLKKTVNYLSQFGEVYLVRLPISSIMLEKERALFPHFNNFIQEIAVGPNIHYLNFSEYTGYQFIDTHHHLSGKSAREFTLHLAKAIQTNN